MRSHFRLLLCLPILIAVSPARAPAQRGSLIEDLFRGVAEAQLEREKRKRLEREEEMRRAPAPRSGGIQPIPIPAPRTGRDRGPRSINTPSREVADMAQHLIDFSGVINPLVQELREAAAGNPAIRNLLPEAYHIAADTDALIQRCDGLRSIDPLIEPYSELDAHWRKLSFQLRSLNGLSSSCTAGIRSCDKLVGAMSGHLHIQPQFDRHGLHDLMVIAGAHMQSMLDDLELARIDPRESKRLMHDLRLLRQQMLGEADRVDDVTYDEAVAAFNDFTTRWSQFSENVYAINDPHLQRRLDRIRRAGDQTYAMLWIPPPYNASTLTASARRLESECAKILDLLTIRSMVTLDAQDQVRLLESSRRMFRGCQEFTRLTTGNASQQELQQRFAAIDKDWAFIHSTCRRLPSIKRAPLAAVEHQCEDLRGALGVSASETPTIGHEELEQAAASLEGSAAYFEADLKRYERHLKPEDYRKSIFGATREFYHHAKELHEALHQREDLSRLQREAGHMLDGWQQLSKDLSDIERHGLSERRAAGLRRAQQNIAPVVAQIAAALLER
jgi:hypothetical protein